MERFLVIAKDRANVFQADRLKLKLTVEIFRGIFGLNLVGPLLIFLRIGGVVKADNLEAFS